MIRIQDRDEVRNFTGLNVEPSDLKLKQKRYTGELHRRVVAEDAMQLLLKRRNARHDVEDVFLNVFMLLKAQNKEKWAARVIKKWWRKMQ